MMRLKLLALALAFILPLFAAENIKSINGVAKANIKAVGPVDEANIKAVGPVDNTAAGGTLATDDFNRADGSLGANWTIQLGSNMAIVSNEAKTSTTGADQLAFWDADTFADDQYAQAKFVNTSGGLNGVCVRNSVVGASKNSYFLRLDGIHKFVGGAYTKIKNATETTDGDDIFKLTISGDTLTGYKNGVQFVTVDDSDLTSGSPGILQFTSGTAAILDDWEGGDL